MRFLLLGLLVGCAGEGSDIGPRLSRIPNASCKVWLLDGQNRGVVSATVRIAGSGEVARTGRNGRGDFLASPRGRLLVDVDVQNGAATSGDKLASFRVAQTVLGPDLPTPIHVPDLPDSPSSASAVISAGTQASTTTLTALDGSIVTVSSGVSVATPDAAATIDLRVGTLAAARVPGDLPTAASGAIVFGRGVFVSPADATFTPGIDLEVADDLGIGGGPATLYHLDATTGEWQVVPVTVTSSGIRWTAAGALTTGGFYCLGAPAPEATVTGRVVDPDGFTLPGMHVRVDQRHTLTSNAGVFSVSGVAATLSDGSARNAVVEVFAGGSWLPVVATYPTAIVAGANDVGDLELNTLPAGNIRVQQIVRARADPLQPVRLSTLLGAVALRYTSDASGQAFFEDVPYDIYGSQEGRVIDANGLFYGPTTGLLAPGRRWQDEYLFLLERAWFFGTRSTNAYVCDSIGGGPLFEAGVVAGVTPGEGLVGFTRESGSLFTGRDFATRATASVRTERGGRVITHAISYSQPNTDHLEFPLRRVLRTPVGMFDRHGLVAGDLTNVDVTRMHALRATRRLTRQEWWDDLVEGVPLASSLPIDVDPAVTHGAFRAGVAVNGGHLSAIEFTQPGGRDTLQKVGLLADLVPTEGDVVARDIALDHVADTTFTATGALLTADPAVDANALELALAFGQEESRVVEVARDIDGSYAVAGNDLQFTLPALTGALADGEWLALLRGETAAGGVTSSFAALLSFAGAVNADFRLPTFPTLTAPAAGATVPASGFTVQFALPADCTFGLIELRDETAPDLLLWECYVRPTETEFAFVTLPTDVATPLLPGRTYELTVSAWFGGIQVNSPFALTDRLAFRQSVGSIEQDISRVARRTVTITTN